MTEVPHSLNFIGSIIKGEIFHSDLYYALICKFADRPKIVALYTGDFKTKGIEVLPEDEAIQKGAERVAAAIKEGKGLRTQQLFFRNSSEFFNVVTTAAIDSYGSPALARPFLTSLDSLISVQS